MRQPQIQGDSVVSWSADVVATDVNGEIVLMSMERNRCYGLGTTGSDIWRKLESPVSVADVIGELMEEYDAPRETIETDVLRTLTELHEEGLVHIQPNG